jgi:hypothetical protein
MENYNGIADIREILHSYRPAGSNDFNYAIEPLKQNVTVYLDANNNGQLDLGEANQITRPNPTVGTKLNAGSVFTYRSNAVDNNADPLTYSLINAPTGMTVDPTTGIVVWNPTLTQVENYYQELAAEQARLTAIGRGANEAEFYRPARISQSSDSEDERPSPSQQWDKIEHKRCCVRGILSVLHAE